MTDQVLSHLDEGVRVITINRPERHNAMDDDTGALFQTLMTEALEETDSRAILLHGAGKSFCSGRDTTVLGHRARDESDFHFVRRAQEGRLRMQDAVKPIVAAVRGGAIGGGCELALACDVRVASPTLKMALPEINYGILPDTGGTQMMTALIGPSRTKYMVLTGEKIDAETALAWGAVDFVVPDEELDERALTIAKQMASKSPIALAMGKHMVDLMYGPTIRTGTRAELLAQTALFKTEDYVEARAALREKRRPHYKGK